MIYRLPLRVREKLQLFNWKIRILSTDFWNSPEVMLHKNVSSLKNKSFV